MKRALICIAAMLIITAMLHAEQKQPDGKRVKQIQTALVNHGYQSGKTWPQTQEILRGLARERHWQTHYAPDARVLILLGLGNKDSNSDVSVKGKNFLDSPASE